ncbi:MAG TPA: N-6 DNA methylase, partial [Chitinispirillaceae bacterium]|nr:N-6 DNA methylase [Chitinispirillaceae bacterium]
MNYSTIRIEGSILSADILDRLEQGELGGQNPADFGLAGTRKVKDEILGAWADALAMWRIFNRQREKLAENVSGTSETRRYWIVPLLGLMGYTLEVARQGETVNGRNYAISHHAEGKGNFAVHIMGCNDSLDKKREDSGPRMSPHALVQEYLNVTEHLYAIVTNGLQLRLLRDSSRLVKLSFIEFDLQAMMDEEHFSDFAILYRLLHASRMPVTADSGAECLIEKYHQDALESGSRIREGLSGAVEQTILAIANGMLSHPSNNELRELIESRQYTADAMYTHLLRIIYRLLFLMVIEERKLIFPKETESRKVTIYYDYYSVLHLRKLCEKQYIEMQGFSDYWIALRNTFRLFEHPRHGEKLGIPPLAGDLFGPDSIGILALCELDNTVLIECLRNLSLFTNKRTGQKMRVNYASLNVEEFGSVYEALLEYAPELSVVNGQPRFGFVKGDERSKSGSHYTPEELVQPLIKHSLEYVIEEKLKDSDKEKALLSITVCDIACGSGHILLSAARRVAIEVARVRTGEDQPSPKAIRKATRDVIRHCIYGVDKNPLAVELCKVGLWLEAHNPGEPLNFLDHHIKCGDSIVGLVNREELENGIADEAFQSLPDDDKEVIRELRNKNKLAHKDVKKYEEYAKWNTAPYNAVVKAIHDFDELPEKSSEEIELKKRKYAEMTSGNSWWRLKNLADIQTAQFFIAKTHDNANKIITQDLYQLMLIGQKPLQGEHVGNAIAESSERRF